MKKIISFILIIALIMPYFPVTLKVFADTSAYSVVSIKSDGSTKNIGSYNDYNSAKNAMNNYKSSISDVAVIKKGDTVVNAAYGVFRLDSSITTVNLYSDYGNGYISPAYSGDSLILDYNPSNNRVQIMISGIKAWVSLDAGTVHPISYITSGNGLFYDVNKKYVKILYLNGIRLREGPGADTQQVGCVGQKQCSSSQGGIWTEAGAVYEWLNYGSVTNDGTNDWYKVNINGHIGYIANEVAAKDLEEFSPSKGNKQDLRTYYFVNSNGELYHQYYAEASNSNVWSTRLGKAPLYLKQNVNYYSFDGNYFYDDFIKLVNDVKSNSHNNAVNKMPYYNYYQYLPTRTRTVYNADNINSYIGMYYSAKIDRETFYDLVDGKWVVNSNPDPFPSNGSMLYGEGDAFITSQEKYGVNAIETLGLAINESGWGRSGLSVRQYNIFGHGAFDYAPDANAASYESVSAGIMAHAYKYISKDYSNPISGYNYNGSHYGNKLSGNNVSYASDAYWGEKMASNYYSFDKNFSFQDFNQRNVLGVKQISDAVTVYSMPTTKSTSYYKLKNRPNIPVTILEEVEGEEINGSKIWYKIQSDVPIDASRNVVSTFDSYNFDTSYAYVHSSYIYKESKAPVITAKDLTINSGSKFNPLSGVSAYDAWDGDVTSKIVVVSNNVNTSKIGTYNVTYKVTDSENNTAQKTITVNVLNSVPQITASDITLNMGATFNPLANVKAADFEDGDLTSKIKVTSNNVDTNKQGDYSVTYSVTDSNNNTTTKTIKVTVKAPVYKEVENTFYFDSLKVVNDKLHLKGFVTLNGVNNNLNNSITYKLVFRNELTNEETVQTMTRITNKDNMPFMIEGEKGLDYTYSWFEGDIDVSKLNVGDYTLYLIVNDNQNITEVPLSNVFGAPMVSTYSTDKKNILIRNNYESRDAAIQFFVREEAIGKKTSNPKYNINNEYSTINFKDNKLVIKGASHIIGGDYAKNTDVKRTLILENTKTFERYSYDIGSITNGDYTIELRVPDGFDKTRGWFETNLDLSKLPNGTYAIYISTSSNVSDFGELQDIFSRKINASLTNNGKNYSFSVNKSKRYRIELTVKDA